jgi:Ras-associated and pleckstrin homology domains-containing protein 1
VRRLFVKAFGEDGSSKSLLVDERMNCGFITKLLAGNYRHALLLCEKFFESINNMQFISLSTDKNHVNMEVSWGLIEYMPELYIERLYEDHELLVENLLQWSTDSKNRVLFIKRSDRVALFLKPEKYLPSFEMAPGNQHDEESR